MKKEEENKKFSIKELFKNKQYYAILNLVFYSVLIFILILCVRTGDGGTTNQQNSNGDINNSVSEVVGFDYIKNKNFEFSYSLKIDEKEVVYQGKQYNDKILFDDLTNNKQYYVNEDIYLVKSEEQYVLTETPLQYFNYLSVETIENILKSATSDEDELIISLKSFLEVVGIDIEYDGDDDIIINLTKQNNNIIKIESDITSFIQLYDEEVNEAKLILNYSNFNLVEDFKVQ